MDAQGLMFVNTSSLQVCEWIQEPHACLLFDPLSGRLDSQLSDFDKSSAESIKQFCRNSNIKEPIRIECVFTGCWVMKHIRNLASQAGLPITRDAASYLKTLMNTLQLAEVFELVHGRTPSDRERAFLCKYESPITSHLSQVRASLPVEPFKDDRVYTKRIPPAVAMKPDAVRPSCLTTTQPQNNHALKAWSCSDKRAQTPENADENVQRNGNKRKVAASPSPTKANKKSKPAAKTLSPTIKGKLFLPKKSRGGGATSTGACR